MVGHGRSRYLRHGCRCDVCKRAHREYMRQYREDNAVARAYDRWQRATYDEALRVLRERHHDEFEQIVAEVRERKAAS